MPEPSQSVVTAAGAVVIFQTAAEASRAAASRIAEVIAEAVAARGKAVLGLATGGSPIAVYQRLVERYTRGELAWDPVISYNLDEYYPIAPNDPNSYRAYMERHLFAAVKPEPNRAHVFDGTVPEAFASEHATQFDRWIAADGGLDLQLLGIGRNGHIGFNEPDERPIAEALQLPSRLERLHPVTLADAARDFGGDESRVPRLALTVGTATILAARSIAVLAFGVHKAEAVALAHRGPLTSHCPASLLQTAAERVTWYLDAGAAQGLTDP
jgi:glucosamine-6-phosphate deaminase